MEPAGKKILLVDDEPEIRQIITRRLKKFGFSILTAEDGEEALRCAREEKPDLMILDLNLPLLPGEEVCKALREDFDGLLWDMPIIMLTGKDSEVDRIVGKVLGANSYLVKPCPIDTLLGEIRRFIA